MYETVAKDFEALGECHMQFLIDAAKGNYDEIWINMCNIYGFRGRETILRAYCWQYSRTHQKT